MEDLYQIEKKIFKGESVDQDTINKLVDLCENRPNNRLGPYYVWKLLSQKDRKCKVYMKNKRILSKKTNDGVAGFVIYTFEPKSEDEGNCKIKDTTMCCICLPRCYFGL